MRIITIVALATLAAVLVPGTSSAQVPLTTSYTQSFDSLSSTGNNNQWTDNVTIVGWYATETSYRADDGGSNSGGLYSFGVAGVHPVTDRALGSLPNGSTGDIRYAVRLLNASSSAITQIDVSYIGEQWRNGGVANTNTLIFDYLLTSLPGNQLTAAGYLADANLNFTTPIVGTPSGALDGNAPANRLALSDRINLNWAPGDYLWVRWSQIRQSGSNHGMAIDDFSIAVVPEPVTLVAVGAVGLGGGLWYRRRRQLQAALIKAHKEAGVRFDVHDLDDAASEESEEDEFWNGADVGAESEERY